MFEGISLFRRWTLNGVINAGRSNGFLKAGFGGLAEYIDYDMPEEGKILMDAHPGESAVLADRAGDFPRILTGVNRKSSFFGG